MPQALAASLVGDESLPPQGAGRIRLRARQPYNKQGCASTPGARVTQRGSRGLARGHAPLPLSSPEAWGSKEGPESPFLGGSGAAERLLGGGHRGRVPSERELDRKP